MTSKPIFTSDIAHHLIRRAIRWGILLGLVCGVLAGLRIFIIGALFGLILGPIVGALSGLLSGWVLYAVTTQFYLPMSEGKYRQYRLAAGLVCVAISVGVVYVFQGVLFHSNPDMTSYVITFIFIPSIAAALWSSQSLATWYIEYSKRVP